MNRQRMFSCTGIRLVLCASVGFLQCVCTATTFAASHRIAVSDTWNNRVLIFDYPLSTNESASVVLGQADFFHGAPNRGENPAADTLRNPQGLATDSSGNLYVADTGNCRILQFHPPFTSGMNASLIIQDPGFATKRCDADAPDYLSQVNGLAVPASIMVDRSGDLIVSDSANSHILEYAPPFSSGIPPTVVLGRSWAVTYDPLGCPYPDGHPTASTLCRPRGTAFDSGGDLWLVDGANRVLEFAPPFSPGMAAKLELGQPADSDFTSDFDRAPWCQQHFAPDDPTYEKVCPDGRSSPSSESLSDPASIAFDAHGNLWVADEANGRILEYVPPFSNGMAATKVIGEVDFRHQGLGGPRFPPVVSASTLIDPSDFSFDSSGDLLVVDHLQNRILGYKPPIRSSMPAVLVLGRADFSGYEFHRGGVTANRFDGPSYLLVF